MLKKMTYKPRLGVLVALGAVAALLVMAVGATGASAATPEWEWSECSLLNEPVGAYEDSGCTILSPTHEGFYEITWHKFNAEYPSMDVVSKGTLELENTENKVKVSCEGSNEGTVEEKGKDKITSITASKCKILNAGSVGCGEPTKAEALHLPWDTQLEEPTAGELRDKISGSGNGNPGWKIECTVFGIFHVAESCTAPEASTLIENMADEMGFDSIFQGATSGEANCGGATGKEGIVTGTVEFEPSAAEKEKEYGWVRAT